MKLFGFYSLVLSFLLSLQPSVADCLWDKIKCWFDSDDCPSSTTVTQLMTTATTRAPGPSWASWSSWSQPPWTPWSPPPASSTAAPVIPGTGAVPGDNSSSAGFKIINGPRGPSSNSSGNLTIGGSGNSNNGDGGGIGNPNGLPGQGQGGGGGQQVQTGQWVGGNSNGNNVGSSQFEHLIPASNQNGQVAQIPSDQSNLGQSLPLVSPNQGGSGSQGTGLPMQKYNPGLGQQQSQASSGKDQGGQNEDSSQQFQDFDDTLEPMASQFQNIQDSRNAAGVGGNSQGNLPPILSNSNGNNGQNVDQTSNPSSSGQSPQNEQPPMTDQGVWTGEGNFVKLVRAALTLVTADPQTMLASGVADTVPKLSGTTVTLIDRSLLPSFLQSASEQAIVQYLAIERNDSLTKDQTTVAKDQWALTQPANVQTQYQTAKVERNAQINRIKSAQAEAAMNLSPKAIVLYGQIQAILNDGSITRAQERAQIAAAMAAATESARKELTQMSF